MTPEEKAEAIALMLLGRTATAAVPIIARAIREAENDALERAATRAEGIATMEHEAGGPANDDLMSLVVNQIRALKHKD